MCDIFSIQDDTGVVARGLEVGELLLHRTIINAGDIVKKAQENISPHPIVADEPSA